MPIRQEEDVAVVKVKEEIKNLMFLSKGISTVEAIFMKTTL